MRTTLRGRKMMSPISVLARFYRQIGARPNYFSNGLSSRACRARRADAFGEAGKAGCAIGAEVAPFPPFLDLAEQLAHRRARRQAEPGDVASAQREARRHKARRRREQLARPRRLAGPGGAQQHEIAVSGEAEAMKRPALRTLVGGEIDGGRRRGKEDETVALGA